MENFPGKGNQVKLSNMPPNNGKVENHSWIRRIAGIFIALSVVLFVMAISIFLLPDSFKFIPNSANLPSPGQATFYPKPSVLPDSSQDPKNLKPKYYLSIQGTSLVKYSDVRGNTFRAFYRDEDLKKLSDKYNQNSNLNVLDLVKIQNELGDLPAVNLQILGDKKISLGFVSDKTFITTIQSESQPITLEVNFGFDTETKNLLYYKYEKLNLAPGQSAQIQMTPLGISPLLLDRGDNKFTQVKTPGVLIMQDQ